MDDPQQQPAPSSSRAAGDTAPTTQDEEAVLGWECANPALQIERWGQETSPPGQSC